MIGYIFLSLVKILDNIILTFKSITTYKEQKILSSILVIISQLIFYLVIDQVISDNTILSIVIVSVSSGIGNYIALSIKGSIIRLETYLAEGKPVKKSTHCGLTKEEMEVPIIII